MDFNQRIQESFFLEAEFLAWVLQKDTVTVQLLGLQRNII